MPDLREDQFATGARLAARAAIRDVRVFALSAELKGFPDAERLLRYEFTSDLEPDEDDGDGSLVVQGKYHLEIFSDLRHSDAEPPSDEENEPLSVCDFIVAALYEVTPKADEREFSVDERRAFAESTAQFALYPYARQLANDLTSRIGLPPLTLPILQVSLEQDPTSRLGTSVIEDESTSTASVVRRPAVKRGHAKRRQTERGS